MPSIWESTCSAGVETSDSTSFTEAPGNGMKTFAIVTLICGSSSRGVTDDGEDAQQQRHQRDRAG